MRRASLILIILTTIPALWLMSASSKTESEYQTAQPRSRATSTVQKEIALQKTISTQQRINRYFHDDVMPKLKTCWGNLQSKGTISGKYTYKKTGTRWIFSQVDSQESTLPAAQARLAVKCMTTAAQDTSFPVAGSDTTTNDFVLTWTWPVPFPANAAQLTTAMFAARGDSPSGGGGCDGRGAPAKCFNCFNLLCYRSCVGYDKCTTTFDAGNNPTKCSNSISCASGGPFGVGGSTVIY